jgi:hypothetical protein
LLRLNAVVGREGHRQRLRPAHACRHHLRSVPLVRGQFVCSRHRAPTGRLGEHRPQRRCDRRALADAGRRHEGGVPHVGDRASTTRGTTRSTESTSFRSTARRCRS